MVEHALILRMLLRFPSKLKYKVTVSETVILTLSVIDPQLTYRKMRTEANSRLLRFMYTAIPLELSSPRNKHVKPTYIYILKKKKKCWNSLAPSLHFYLQLYQNNNKGKINYRYKTSFLKR